MRKCIIGERPCNESISLYRKNYLDKKRQTSKLEQLLKEVARRCYVSMSFRGSPLNNEKCRQCSSFQDYFKQTRKQFQQDSKEGTANSGDEEMKPRRDDCPLDKDELGNKSWGLLHTMAAKYPENPTDQQKTDMKKFFFLFSKFYPCEHCAADFQEELKVNPPKIDSQNALSQWLCDVHNKVNVKLGKDEFDCSKVNERWRDGWLDGSCDY